MSSSVMVNALGRAGVGYSIASTSMFGRVPNCSSSAAGGLAAAGLAATAAGLAGAAAGLAGAGLAAGGAGFLSAGNGMSIVKIK